MFIETITIEEGKFIEDMDNIINEINKKLINDSIRKSISTKKKRQLLYEKHGKKSFLLPNTLKFPVVNVKTGKYDCNLIYSARLRAKQNIGLPGYREVVKKAEELFKENKCQNKINIYLKESDEIIDLNVLIDLIT